jgi:hypothetical protein
MKSDSDLSGNRPLPVAVRGSFGALLLMGGVMLLAPGCKTQTPMTAGFPLPYPTPSSSLRYVKVCDFESSPATLVNPGLFDRGNPPTYELWNPGWIETWGGATVSITVSGPVPGGAAGTATSYACMGTIVDLADGTYPSFSLNARFKSDGAVYDMSAFTGVQYQLKVEGDDTAPWRAFTIPLSTTMPVTSGGTCVSNCYDHFYVAYGTTGGAWVPVVNAFTDFKRQGYGDPLVPSNLTGANLENALGLEWVESNRNAPGTILFDFSLDEIRFY